MIEFESNSKKICLFGVKWRAQSKVLKILNLRFFIKTVKNRIEKHILKKITWRVSCFSTKKEKSFWLEAFWNFCYFDVKIIFFNKKPKIILTMIELLNINQSNPTKKINKKAVRWGYLANVISLSNLFFRIGFLIENQLKTTSRWSGIRFLSQNFFTEKN